MKKSKVKGTDVDKRKAVAYARFSSDNQNQNSIEYQITEIKKYCKANNIELVKKYEDEGFSGTTSRRPAFKRLIKDAMNKPEWDLILVYDLSRFSRNYNDAVTYETMLKDCDIDLVSITQRFDNSNEGEAEKS